MFGFLLLFASAAFGLTISGVTRTSAQAPVLCISSGAGQRT
jgi:hypothetical protein